MLTYKTRLLRYSVPTLFVMGYENEIAAWSYLRTITSESTSATAPATDPKILKENITALEDIGLKVCELVCDQAKIITKLCITNPL